MRIFLHFIPFLLVLAVAGTATAGNPGLHLRENVVVTSKYVKLGDLFENAGKYASIAVFRAPDPGKSGFVRTDRIAAAARRHGLIWQNPDNIPRVNVARDSRLIRPERITASIQKEAARVLGISTADRESLRLRFNTLPKPLHLPLESGAGKLKVARMELDEKTGHFTATLDVGSVAVSARDLTFTGQVARMVEIPVPGHAIKRGQIIESGDIEWRRFDAASLPAKPVRKVESIIGMAARNRLQPGRPLQTRDIGPPNLVMRNKSVTIIYRQPGMILSTRGKALASGSKGQTVAVLNARSRRIIEAVVIAPQTVTPILAGSRPAALVAKRN
ncbi:MAG TPA: flagellar basal body P-ring formation protein FlgA [Rhodobacteraceae bacterium]|nr:flagellar basal body P-ring formation protein FlgA [Paracoccaceae bacterium]